MPSGFSQRTCLPARAAAIVGSACSAFGPPLSNSADAVVGDLLAPVRDGLRPAVARGTAASGSRSRPEIETSSGRSGGSSSLTARSARE